MAPKITGHCKGNLVLTRFSKPLSDSGSSSQVSSERLLQLLLCRVWNLFFFFFASAYTNSSEL